MIILLSRMMVPVAIRNPNYPTNIGVVWVPLLFTYLMNDIMGENAYPPFWGSRPTISQDKSRGLSRTRNFIFAEMLSRNDIQIKSNLLNNKGLKATYRLLKQ